MNSLIHWNTLHIFILHDITAELIQENHIFCSDRHALQLPEIILVLLCTIKLVSTEMDKTTTITYLKGDTRVIDGLE